MQNDGGLGMDRLKIESKKGLSELMAAAHVEVNGFFILIH